MTDESGTAGSELPMAPNEFTEAPAVSQRAATGLQKLPRVWAYLTKDAKGADAGTAGTDAFANPMAVNEFTPTAEVKPSPGETQNSERSAFSGDWPAFDGDAPAFSGDAPAYDRSAYFDTLPPDLQIDHYDQPIVESFAQHMHGHGMSPTQVHESLRWVNSYVGNDADEDLAPMLENFVKHMGQYGLTRAQANEALSWLNGYAGSETQQDDEAVASVDAAIAQIQELMGTPAYTKNEEMQANYRLLLSVRDGNE